MSLIHLSELTCVPEHTMYGNKFLFCFILPPFDPTRAVCRSKNRIKYASNKDVDLN